MIARVEINYVAMVADSRLLAIAPWPLRRTTSALDHEPSCLICVRRSSNASGLSNVTVSTAELDVSSPCV